MQLEPKRLTRACRLPIEMLAKQLGPRCARQPPLDHSCFDVDNPVYGHVSLIQLALLSSISAFAAWRDDLSREEQRSSCSFDTKATGFIRRDHKNVRLNKRAPLDFRIER